MASRIF